jgi:ankyrin repeat protein
LWLSSLAAACVLISHRVPRAEATDKPSGQGLLAAVHAGANDAVQRLLRQGADVNAHAEDGTTALMLATVVGDIQLVHMLLEDGADVNAKNRAGASALMWAVGDADKTRALLDHGADVNVRADSGRTPLMIAVGSPGAAVVVQLLIDKGADVRYEQQGYTVLMAAVEGGNRTVVQLLLAKGADAKAKNRAGYTALHAAALLPDCGIAEDLLAHGADVNAADTLQRRTPLLWAATTGRTDLVKFLLDHGADVSVRETLGGTTPLICVAASERGELGLVNLLLEKGADPGAKDDQGDSALDWASKRGRREIVQALRSKGAPSHAAEPQPARPHRRDDNTVSKAVEAALPLVQQSSATFLAKSGAGCISCHHQSLPALAIQFARQARFKVDDTKARQQAEAVRRTLERRRESLLQGAGVVDRLDAGYWLIGLAALGVARDDTTDALAHYLMLKEAKDGHWRTTLFRPPANDSDFTATALAVRGLQLFGPPGRSKEIAGRVGKARAWLVSGSPRTTEDRTFQLLGLKWAGAPKENIARAAAALLAEQREEGSWGQLMSMPGDAYATGQVLTALQQSGAVSIGHPAYSRGLQWLLKTQRQDGSWFVESRSLPVNPYFESGFPHGRSQFISCAATSWATIALAASAEPSRVEQ